MFYLIAIVNFLYKLSKKTISYYQESFQFAKLTFLIRKTHPKLFAFFVNRFANSKKFSPAAGSFPRFARKFLRIVYFMIIRTLGTLI